MTSIHRSFGRLLPVLFLVPALAGELRAQEPGDPVDLPPARDLIDRYVEAIGGRQAHARPTSIRSVGSLSMPTMGLEGEFELLQLPSRGSRMRTVIPGLGEMLVGFDGEVGWSVNAMTGPSLMEGDELEQVRERSLLEAALRSPEVIAESETVERTEFGETACWRVRLVWRSGRETHDCYALETGLLVASEETQASATGEVPVVTIYADYREFHGMNLPTTLRQSTMGIEQVMEIHEVFVDDADPSALEPPPAIRVLLGRDPGN